jgi:hypothetical protein
MSIPRWLRRSTALVGAALVVKYLLVPQLSGLTGLLHEERFDL